MGFPVQRLSYFWKTAILILIYFATARFGLHLGAVSTFAALIWPPAGISLAALLILGAEFWPAIFIAAFLVNYSIGASILTAIAMGIGNVTEAVLAAYLIRRLGYLRSLESLRSISSFLIAVVTSTLVSASIGVGSLYFGGHLEASHVNETWLAWWMGDVMGDLLFGSFLIVWANYTYEKMKPKRILEVSIILATAFLFSIYIFTDWVTPKNPIFPKPFSIFPIMMIIAARLGLRGVTSITLLLTFLILYATHMNMGRFIAPDTATNLMQIQVFLTILSTATLFLAATISERKRLYKEAKMAIRSRDEFLSIVSHELKNPLATLSLRLQIFNHMLNNAKKDDTNGTVQLPIKSLKSFALCDEQTKRIISSLNNLLDLSRIRFDKLELTKDNADLSSISLEVAEYLAVEAVATGSRILVQAEEVVLGLWDRMRIEQVISNLVSNALKYGCGAPITITVKKDPRHQQATLIVHDEGPGIPSHKLSTIFERFERAVDPKDKTSGMGLGLYICHQIVEAHGGTIQADSSPGQGTTFTVNLPLS